MYAEQMLAKAAGELFKNRQLCQRHLVEQLLTKRPSKDDHAIDPTGQDPPQVHQEQPR